MRCERHEPDALPIQTTDEDREIFADDYPPETFDIGDVVTANLMHGKFEKLEITRVYPKARRFRLRGWLGRYWRSGDPKIETIQVAFDDVELEARAS